MLKQASVEQIRERQIPRENSHIVIGMCFYPRGIKKELSDEYRKELAPDPQLFQEWKNFEREHGHDEAFRLSDYENRFTPSPIALFHLKEYADMSASKDVYIVCQCAVGERCHREMLLLTAQKRFGTKIGPVFHSYPQYEKRIPALDGKIKLW